jgi:hypothetical protein
MSPNIFPWLAKLIQYKTHLQSKNLESLCAYDLLNNHRFPIVPSFNHKSQTEAQGTSVILRTLRLYLAEFRGCRQLLEQYYKLIT